MIQLNSSECLLPTEFGSHCIHTDTSNFSVTEKYDSDFNTEKSRSSMPTQRMACKIKSDVSWHNIKTAWRGIPLFLQTFSGNESNKETHRAIIEKRQTNLKSDDTSTMWLKPHYNTESKNDVRNHLADNGLFFRIFILGKYCMRTRMPIPGYAIQRCIFAIVHKNMPKRTYRNRKLVTII